MSLPKRHHIVPKSYLENFCRDGLLWVYDRNRKEYRQQLPKDTCVQGHYYTQIGPNGEKNTDVETFFSKIEGQARDAIQKIDAEEPITPKEKQVLTVFASFMMTRVPEFEKLVNEHYEKSALELSKVLLQSEEQAADLIKKLEEESGQTTDTTPRELMEFAQSGDYTIKQSNRGYTLSTMIEVSQPVMALIHNMTWLFMQSPNGSSFVTSDNPFVIPLCVNVSETLSCDRLRNLWRD